MRDGDCALLPPFRPWGEQGGLHSLEAERLRAHQAELVAESLAEKVNGGPAARSMQEIRDKLAGMAQAAQKKTAKRRRAAKTKGAKRGPKVRDGETLPAAVKYVRVRMRNPKCYNSEKGLCEHACKHYKLSITWQALRRHVRARRAAGSN